MKTRTWFTGALMLVVTLLSAQEGKKSLIPLIGSDAPAFTAETTNGTLNFPGDYGKSWKILFSHPQDFTPVCTTEIMELARQQEAFKALGVEVAVISTDTKERHLMWKKSMEELLSLEKGQPRIGFPLIDDSKVTISRQYGMLHEPVSTTRDVRGVFVINPQNKVEATFFYPHSIGRNMEEIVRTVEALQISYASDLMTPANWEPGGDLLVPHNPYTQAELLTDPELEEQFYQIGSLLWYKRSSKP